MNNAKNATEPKPITISDYSTKMAALNTKLTEEISTFTMEMERAGTAEHACASIIGLEHTDAAWALALGA